MSRCQKWSDIKKESKACYTGDGIGESFDLIFERLLKPFR